MRECKEIYNYEQYKKRSRVTKEKLDRRAWGLEGWAPDWSTANPRRYHYATLINRKSTKVQAPGSGHADPGLSEATERAVR